MRKVRSLTELLEVLDSELAWRIKEVSDLRLALVSSPIVQQSTLARASVPIYYAHWEGFVKNSTEYWLAYVASQGLKYRQLKACFIANGLKRYLDELVEVKKSGKAAEVVGFLTSRLDERARLRVEGGANTKANLSSEVFDDLARSVGVDPTPYLTKYKLIDERLLKRRNTIAHGQFDALTIQEIRELEGEVIGLLRQYKNDLQNLAATNGYLVAA